MLDKQTSIDHIEILNNQTVAVRYLITILENNQLFGTQVKNNYIKPGDDYSAEDAKIQAICAAVHTPEVVTAYKEAQNVTPTA